MEKHEAILAELGQLRDSAAAKIRAKVEAALGQVRELSVRAAGELGAVIPPDLETLFPMAGLSERLQDLAKPVAPAGVSLEVMRRLDAGRAQSEVLQDLLRVIGGWCGPRAIVVLRDGNAVQGWAGEGFGAGSPVKTWHGALATSAGLRRVADGVPVVVDLADEEMLSRWFDAPKGRLLLVPMSLRGKVVGMLLALEGESGLDTAIVQQLTYTVGLMLETLSGRTVPTAALQEAEDLTGTRAAVAPPVGVPTSNLFELEEGAPTPAMMRMAPPEVTPPVADASATVHLKVPVAPTMPPPAPPPPPPAVAPRAPTAPARPAEDERKHEEARRFARLLVSEIRLYNEQAVQAGKISRDIYQRLKDDIDRSREMYEQRVSADVRASTNYFHDELVRILADGEADALGI
ncbi:MAG: hypothetical protein A2Y78_12690 [Acidobacteria bacterium RBG_13_68_16]|nr:MAG: hypothetical protein A2Y78_12690 [Acidobacteria bacterium RBG_13_68_16]